MAKGIVVLLPDDLFEKVESLKGKIDVSEICSRALSREIEKLEKRREEGRVEIKMADYIELWENRGTEDGKKDAENFSYRAFMETIKIYKKLDEFSGRFDLDEIIPGEIYDSLLHHRLKDLESDSPEKAAYLRGWLRGVALKWDEIKDRF